MVARLVIVSAAIASTALAAGPGYENGMEVPVSMNKIWPQDNPTEMYNFYSFPYCKTEAVKEQWMTLGHVLRGDRLMSAAYDIKFKQNVTKTLICNQTINYMQLFMVKSSIDQRYNFEMYVGDLPIIKPIGAHVAIMDSEREENLLEDEQKAFVDESDGRRYMGQEKWYFLNHFEFELGYNGGQIVSADLKIGELDTHYEDVSEIKVQNTDTNLTQALGGLAGMISPRMRGKFGSILPIPFYYSVTWHKSDITLEDSLKTQMLNMVQSNKDTYDIRWVPIINSFVLVLVVVSVLALIMFKAVRSDLNSLALEDGDEEMQMTVPEQTGWKLLGADVFRRPAQRMLFCAAVGSGLQLFLMMLMLIIVGCVGMYYEAGALRSTAVAAYSLTAACAGYTSATLYTHLGGEALFTNLLLTSGIFAGPAFGVWAILNTIAIFYGSTAAMPFGTILFAFGLYLGVTMPLTFLGGFFGKRNARSVQKPFPTKTSKLPREIPRTARLRGCAVQTIIIGIFPLPSIYMELHYILNSVWGNRMYTMYGMLLLSFIMLCLVSIALTLLFTYLHLNEEDYRWWWRSWASGPAVAYFFYMYCLMYHARSHMHGMLQSSYFLLYTLLMAWGLSLMLGSLTVLSSLQFLRFLYSKVKGD